MNKSCHTRYNLIQEIHKNCKVNETGQTRGPTDEHIAVVNLYCGIGQGS